MSEKKIEVEANAGQGKDGVRKEHHEGFDWNGPTGMWLFLFVTVLATIGIGLYIG